MNIFNNSLNLSFRKVKNRLLVALNSKKQKDFPLKRRRNNDKYRYLMMRGKLRNLAFDQKFTVINFWESHVVSHVYSSLCFYEFVTFFMFLFVFLTRNSMWMNEPIRRPILKVRFLRSSAAACTKDCLVVAWSSCLFTCYEILVFLHNTFMLVYEL